MTSVPSSELRDRIAAAARTVQLRLGPNALAIAQVGSPIRLSGGEADALADAVLATVQPELDRLRAELSGARVTIEHMSKAMSWISGHDRQGLDHLDEAQREARAREAAVRQAQRWATQAKSATAELEQARADVERIRTRENEVRTARRQALRELEQARQQTDVAYRERAQLTAWLAALHPAVIAPAPDVDEPGWQILYLYAHGRQMSWHIHPRDAELYTHVERVSADDPRAQWDGHTTEQKYEAIRAATQPST